MVADGQGQVRRNGIRRAVVVAGLVVAVAGGIAGWNAVAELDDAHTRAARARRDFADLEGTVRARLDEAAGRAGLDIDLPASDDDLAEVLVELGVPVEVADVLLVQEDELRADVAADGAADERLLARLTTTLRDIERETVRPAADEADDAETAARATVGITAAATAALWLAAAWLHRAPAAEHRGA